MSAINWIKPDWDVPDTIGCVSTTRVGGVSKGCYAGLNLSDNVGDDDKHVGKNRKLVFDEMQLPAEPTWLNQQHGNNVVNLSDASLKNNLADASYSIDEKSVCAVLTADCLPVLFCDSKASCVAAAHAGWRGLYKGVLENTLEVLPTPQDKLKCWLGPAIGAHKFEVGSEVRQLFLKKYQIHENAFKSIAEDKFLADIYQIARNILIQNGVERIFGGRFCTYSDSEQFYSYRRDGITGRMATLIWFKS